MTERVRVTTSVAQVLVVLLDDPRVGRYGLELIRATGLPSGTVYPILARLREAGWVRADWEDIDPVAEGRPARRYYQLTGDGVAAARAELASLYGRLRMTGGPQVAGAATFTPAPGW